MPATTWPMPGQEFESRAQGPERAVIGGHGALGESDGCPQELAALVEHVYSMIWSARRSTDCGIVSPRVLAVLRLMTSSNLVGCSTGRSAGLAPLRMRST